MSYILVEKYIYIYIQFINKWINTYIDINVNFFLLVLNQKLRDDRITDIHDILVYRRELQFIIYNIYFTYITLSAKETLNVLVTMYFSTASDSCHIQVDRTEWCGRRHPSVNDLRSQSLHPWWGTYQASQGLREVGTYFASRCVHDTHSTYGMAMTMKYEIRGNRSWTYHWPAFSPVWWLMNDLFWCLLFWNFKSSMRQAYRNIYYRKQSGLPVYKWLIFRFSYAKETEDTTKTTAA